MQHHIVLAPAPQVTTFLTDLSTPNNPSAPYNRQTAAWLPPCKGLPLGGAQGGTTLTAASSWRNGYATVAEPVGLRSVHRR
jgi:hypothetical protein